MVEIESEDGMSDPEKLTQGLEMYEALLRARNTAMEQAIEARAPECGHFAGIAQDLDWLLNRIKEIK
ncbi:hypothetical protein UFOVP393_71 [uncultured Caudovirales phage]|uniref:Uncharacterized protein n=1 Tax=uncultured Caudovirales phage TaxID=2100421 RepID=A0A6J7X7I3_9CAUD|nr:hypothetical protein UFOVP393_71 [uncultured Caudovirales phage]